ncbi:hypothetical protein Ocin01_09635, partial [Orchesella cincta]
ILSPCGTKVRIAFHAQSCWKLGQGLPRSGHFQQSLASHFTDIYGSIAARGTAILYVAKKNQPFIHPGFIKCRYSQPAKLQDEFFWTGTMDFSSYMTVPAALQFAKGWWR